MVVVVVLALVLVGLVARGGEAGVVWVEGW
jgi:hypothetical protein